MIRVFITKQSNYPVRVGPIKKKLAEFLVKSGIVSDAEVSIAVVGRERMLEIARRYTSDKKLHNVLSFTAGEVKGNFSYPLDGIIRLGEIVVCYPLAVAEA